MAKSTKNPRKKPRGRPAVDSEQVNLRIQRPELNAIEKFAKDEVDKPARPEAIRRIIRNWLRAKGYLPK